jgi:hypothetical protein
VSTAAGPLIHERCWHHREREAAVRCPECRRFYCRECVTEHQGRMVCAACVASLAGRAALSARGLPRLAWIAASAGGLLLAWAIFYYLGAMLAGIPSDFFSAKGAARTYISNQEPIAPYSVLRVFLKRRSA